jgi:hypothetical protein
MDVVNDDWRRNSGQEGCGVELGAAGFSGQAQRCATMSRKENLGEMRFADGSGSVDCEERWQWS